MDWNSVFDEAYPVAGATPETLAKFVIDVTRPMSDQEIASVNAGQINPFSLGSALHASYKPFDAAEWIIPGRPVPAAYLSLLRWSNGGEFLSGEQLFQFFPAIDAVHGVRAMLLAYHVPQYMPGALPFAFDGCGTFYLFDMRKASPSNEYPIVCSHAGNLGWQEDECDIVGDSFLSACSKPRNFDTRDIT